MEKGGLRTLLGQGLVLCNESHIEGIAWDQRIKLLLSSFPKPFLPHLRAKRSCLWGFSRASSKWIYVVQKDNVLGSYRELAKSKRKRQTRSRKQELLLSSENWVIFIFFFLCLSVFSIGNLDFCIEEKKTIEKFLKKDSQIIGLK